jgi:lon-related putative ATP-dependent protease
VAGAHLRWTCPPADLERAVAQEGRAAEAEAKALAKEVPEAKERARRLERAKLDPHPRVEVDELVGQERAVQALRDGLATAAPGFHVYVAGPNGSGREALVRAVLAAHRPPLPRPKDRVFVANFQQPTRPRVLTLPRGKGRKLVRDLDQALAVLTRAIPAALSHEEHVARVERLRRRSEAAAGRLVDDLAAELRVEGLVVGPLAEGMATPELLVDVGDGEPLTVRQVEARLAKKRLKGVRAIRGRLRRHAAAREALELAVSAARAQLRAGATAIRRLEARVARDQAQGFLDDLAAAYPTAPVRRWLDALGEAIGERYERFLDAPGRDDEEEGGRRGLAEPLAAFRARLFVDAKAHPTPPVIHEPNPTYANLLGGFDASDGPTPDHLRFRSGSLAQALGGVLVVDAGALLHDAKAWGALKRSVQSGWLELPRPESGPGAGLRPEPIRTALKVVAVGSDELYDHMVAYDPAFLDVFKVKAQLEEVVPRTKKTVHALGRALARGARRSGLAAPDAAALARCVERSARRAGRKDRLRLVLGEQLDLLAEADRLRAEAGSKRIGVDHVDAALARRKARHDLGERETQEQLDDRVVLVDVDGARAGVVNALVVYDETVVAYSRPSRVTAAVGVGRAGVLDIEREANFSGDSHRKGVAIVAGLLRERFAQDKPLCLTATVCFEQSYSSIDGDSASLAETLAILSALADAPLDQGWGVTGSINQKGEVQAIGDVNAKVEGFFAACQARGLTGKQGVVIPEANRRDLMLRAEVVAAAERGRFHVVCVRTVEEALGLLTGLPAGARKAPGEPFTEGSVFARADARLSAYAQAARGYPA